MGKTRHLLTQSTLGSNGRFGNQIFQYAFQRILARQLGMETQTPPWIGQFLFGHRDSPIASQFPMFTEGWDFERAVFPAKLFERPPESFDLWGYFQFHTSHHRPHRDFFRSLFRPSPFLEEPLAQATDHLRQRGKTLVGLHLRRGDISDRPGTFAPNAWVLEYLRAIWPTVADPVLYIASDEPENVLGDFAEFRPLTAADLKIKIPEAPFYPDFHVLTQCDRVAIADGTFSFAAAMLNDRATAFFRPRMELKKLAPFDPWDAMPVLYRNPGGPHREHAVAVLDRGGDWVEPLLRRRTDTQAHILAIEPSCEAHIRQILSRQISSGQVIVRPAVSPEFSIDQYCLERQISQLVLLRIEAGVKTLQTLRSASDLLRQKRIPVIQFSFGGDARQQGSMLRQIHDLLKSNGYLLLRMLPNGPQPLGEKIEDEDLREPANFLAMPA